MRIMLRAFLLLFPVAGLLSLSGCDSPASEEGTRLFESLTTSSEYREYYNFSGQINHAAAVFGRITTRKTGVEYPVPGASVTAGAKSSAVTDPGGYYCINNINLTVTDSVEVTQEILTLSVSSAGYRSDSKSLTVRRGQALEANLILESSYAADRPRGSLAGLVRNFYTRELLNSIEVIIAGEKTEVTGFDRLLGCAIGKGEFRFREVPTGIWTMAVTDPTGQFRDQFATVEITVGEKSQIFEMQPAATQTGTLSGIVRITEGTLVESVEVVLDNGFSAVTDQNGWFVLKNSSGSTAISSGTHLITARPHKSYASAINIKNYSSNLTVYPGENLYTVILYYIP
ncbi:MAG: hypothetical protein PHQ23_07335 [Candidatus Wallbacteria bacterium]|nr:hypothetical protein [Candidatus Wallbacteria bacterium]